MTTKDDPPTERPTMVEYLAGHLRERHGLEVDVALLEAATWEREHSLCPRCWPPEAIAMTAQLDPDEYK